MYIKVKVFPYEKKNEITEVGENYFHIKVKAPTERNLANDAVCHVMADYFKVDRNQIRIVSGQKRPNKMLFIKD
jgi:uncharacterized protein